MRRNPEVAAWNRKFQDIVDGKYSNYTHNRLVRYFPDTHLGNGHAGLAEIAKTHDINVSRLDFGEFVIFVNKKQTALKLYAPGNIVAYLKMPGSARINPKVIAMIPRFFNGVEIDYGRALKEVIRKEFPNAN